MAHLVLHHQLPRIGDGMVSVKRRQVLVRAEPADSPVTWQIVVGATAGVTPFVVAGIEFGKRIIAQRQCKSCNGSGLVKKGQYYFRCGACGGFLPWQSWTRFFSGE